MLQSLVGLLKFFTPFHETTEQWRNIQWSHKGRELEFVKDYQPHNDELQQLRVLIHGPTGSGKSSFINSVETVLRGKLTGRALADATSHESFTKKKISYKIQKGGPGTYYPFAFTDTMGFEKKTNNGICVEDIKLALMGHIKDDYTFNPVSTISKDDKYFNKCPTLKDKVHVLVCVIDASKGEILTDEHVAKMRDVRLAASKLAIPQIAILTKIDEACPQIKKDIRNVYMSKTLKDKMTQVSVSLGVPLYCIFPVKNYHSEINTDDDVDTLILSALKKIIDFGEDFVNGL